MGLSAVWRGELVRLTGAGGKGGKTGDGGRAPGVLLTSLGPCLCSLLFSLLLKAGGLETGIGHTGWIELQ